MDEVTKTKANGKPKNRSKVRLPKVVDTKSALQYNSYLMQLTEKGKIDIPKAKQLAYQLQISATLQKNEYEENEIRNIVEFRIEKLKNEVSLRFEKFMENVLSAAGIEIYNQIESEQLKNEKEIRAEINSADKEIYEDIKQKTSYRINEKVAETSPKS